MVYLDGPSLSTPAADRWTFDKYIKILPRSTVPFEILKMRNHALTIDENGIENTISKEKPTAADWQNCERLHKGKKPLRHTTALRKNRRNELVLHKIFGHSQAVDEL